VWLRLRTCSAFGKEDLGSYSEKYFHLRGNQAARLCCKFQHSEVVGFAEPGTGILCAN